MATPRTRRAPVVLAFTSVTLALIVAAALAGAQTSPAGAADPAATLRSQIERTWTVVRLQDGILLVPRRGVDGVGGVEVSGSRIAIDGSAVSRDELRRRLGADADAVVALADLTDSARWPALGIAPPEHAEGDARQPEHAVRVHHSGARVRIGGDVVVPEGDHAGEAAVAILGSVTIDGEVGGDAVAVLGNVKLGPSAVVRGNAVAVGGRLERAEGAQVFGELTEVSIGFPGITVGLPEAPPIRVDFRPGRWLAGVAFAGMTVRMLLFGVAAFLVLLVAPGAVERVQRQVRQAPVRSGVVGIIALVLLVPAVAALCLVLIVSIIGIPLLALLPVLLVAILAAWTVGVVAVASTLGARLLGTWGEGGRPRAGALALGLALVWGLTVFARLAWWASGDLSWPVVSLGIAGASVELLAAAVALGGLLLAWMGRHAGPAIPPVPTVV